MPHRPQQWRQAVDQRGVTLASVRTPLVCLPALLAVLAVAAPAAEAKAKSRGTVCAASAGALRPSPLRACVRTRKAPRALPTRRTGA